MFFNLPNENYLGENRQTGADNVPVALVFWLLYFLLSKTHICPNCIFHMLQPFWARQELVRKDQHATNRVSVTAGWVRWVDWWNCHSASRQIYFCQNIIFCVCWSKGKRQLKNENNWGGWILEFQCNIPPCGCVFYNSLQFAFTVRFNSGQRYFYHKTDITSFW